jgi:prefoldin subunit 5
VKTKAYSALRDSAAVQSFLLSGALVTAIVAASWEYILPKASEIAVLAILGLSVLVTALGVVLTAKQIWQLGRERKTLRRLETADLVKALSLEASPRRPGFAGSVVLRQGQLVSDAIVDDRVPPGDYRGEWRRQAAERTAHYGAIQRFLASALLLLAVLGTFAGLKSALPHLSKALVGATTHETPVRGGTVNARARSGTDGQAALGVTTALDLVANAFGSNFLALLGSLTLASFGYGLARDRRTLLAELDDVATRAWYPLIKPDAGLSTLERAVAEMKGSVAAVAKVGDTMETLNRRLDDFKNTLVDTMQQMVGDVRSSMQANATAADRRQDAQLAEMIRSLTLITRALERTTVGYEGLVKGLEERDLGVATAASALNSSVEQVQATSESLTGAVAELHELRKQVSTREGEYQQRFHEVALALQGAADQVGAAASSQACALQGAGETVTALHLEQQAGWARSAENGAEQLQLLRSGAECLARLAQLLELSHQKEEITHSELGALRNGVQSAVDALSARVEQASQVIAGRLEQRTELSLAQELRELHHAVRDVGGLVQASLQQLGDRVASRRDERPEDTRPIASANGRSGA